MKKILLATALFTSTAALAHDNNCNIELNADVEISPSHIAFSKNDQPVYQINDDTVLLVNNKEVSLDDQQQALVTEYSESIRAMVPEVKAIAIEGISLAQDGIDLAFNKLLGDDNDVSGSLKEDLHLLQKDIEYRLDSDQTISIKEDGTIGGFNDAEFEQRIESSVERAVEDSLGKLMMVVGQKMIMSGGDMDEFGKEMEEFGNTIETEMETRAEKLELKADALCMSAKQIENLETQMSNEIPALKNVDMLAI